MTQEWEPDINDHYHNIIETTRSSQLSIKIGIDKNQ